MQWVSRVGGPEEQQWVIAGVQKSVQVQAGRRSAWNTNFANSAKQKQSKKKKKGEQTNKQKAFLGVLCYIRWQRCSHLSSHCACWEWCSETLLLRNCQTPTAKTEFTICCGCLWYPVNGLDHSVGHLQSYFVFYCLLPTLWVNMDCTTLY